MSMATHLILLAGLWGLYGLIHSVLASRCCKAWFRNRFPAGFKAYRLLFNLVALALLLPPLALMFAWPGAPLWRWPEPLGWLADAAAITALVGFVAMLWIYDSGEFLGLSQLRRESAALDDQEPMRISWAHRFVRHPWYFLGLVIVWTREMDAALLVSAVILTLYLVIGSRLEENKLMRLYGEQYRTYRRRVPGLIPLPWRCLSAAEAETLANPRSS